MYYFIGIKGSGMASLATILYDLGHEVKGSDISKYIFIEDELRSIENRGYHSIYIAPGITEHCSTLKEGFDYYREHGWIEI